MPGPNVRPTRLRPAVFLDRDDTLNVNADLPDEAFPGVRGDLFLPGHVRLLPGVFEACTRLADAGFALVVVTNQACVARDLASVADIEATHDRLRELLTRDDGRCLLDGSYAAPHHPEAVDPDFRGDHPWRKPGPGMLLAAAAELGLDLGRSWLVGDMSRDIEAGISAGLGPDRCLRVGPEGEYRGLPGAAARILMTVGGGQGIPVQTSTVTIRARGTRPLADAETRGTIEAAARAIAERTGVALLELRCDEDSVRATLATHRLAALGFMTELRRSTNAWYARRSGGVLWPETHGEDRRDAGEGDE